MKGKCYIVAALLVVSAENAEAQIKVIEDVPLASAGVVIHADPRLDILVKKYRNVQFGSIYSARGYRVQIYNGNDRTKAMERKMDFMQRFPGITTYLTYVQPQFRVKVGDFKTRTEAQMLYDEVSPLYNPTMIVPDIVVINTLKNELKND
jgi:hypothetical protein